MNNADDNFPNNIVTDLNMIMPGLTGEAGTVSFQNPNNPDEYLRHFGYHLYMESSTTGRNLHIFDVDATFYVVPELIAPGK